MWLTLLLLTVGEDLIPHFRSSISVTCFPDVDPAHVLELPDGDVEGAEGAGPPDARAAVHHDGRAQGVAGPGGLQTPHQLTLLLPDTLRGDRLGRV